MNDSDLRNDSQSKNTYHATTNLNTAIENPQINMNSAVGVNIKTDVSNNDLNTNQVVDNSYSSFDDSQSFENNFQSSQFQDNFAMNTENSVNSQNTFLNKNSAEEVNTQYVPTYSDSTTNFKVSSNKDEVVYAPTLEEKKRPGKKFEISREFKVMLFIVFILFIFILLVPYIYDFFKKLQLVIITG